MGDKALRLPSALVDNPPTGQIRTHVRLLSGHADRKRAPLRDLTITADATGREVFDTTKVLMGLRNVAGPGVVGAGRRLQRGWGVLRGTRHTGPRHGAHRETRTGTVERFVGATPREVLDTARTLGNQVADDHGGVPAGEDRTINEWSSKPTDDGRLEVQANPDIVIGEKLVSAIVSLSGKWLGPISQTLAKTLSCDATVTAIIVDGEKVPLDMGHPQRLFTHHQRKALIVRDQCCVKCGAADGYTVCHHIHHWADGGPTDLDNGCLLCTSCHAQIHASGWDIIMGADRHPWLLPPFEQDPTRTPIPAYNRRTMHLDDIAA
ncbi:hypothetical protein GORHZ_142_00110 [Gordonia rhizosphera NBRC 16068]|uniref:HNH nuclease domain-containing protein n=1 Tax=Gordonia rhizosphera NBRC 16068 TaxID=1108045 RepID=K6WDC0_9ACTN|nr:hypothetical protein GORHZ_142_00110 [Gordonia rhizosphera NBRC 16068]